MRAGASLTLPFVSPRSAAVEVVSFPCAEHVRVCECRKGWRPGGLTEELGADRRVETNKDTEGAGEGQVRGDP